MSKYNMDFDESDYDNADHLDQNAHPRKNKDDTNLENFVDCSDEYSNEYFNEYSDEYGETPSQPQNNGRMNMQQMNIPSFDKIKYSNQRYEHNSNHKNNQNHHYQQHYHQHQHRRQHQNRHQHQYQHRRHRRSLNPADQYRKKIADENKQIVRKHPEIIDWKGIKTIGIDHHFNIPKDINRKCAIRVFDCSTIKAAIECHLAHPTSKICLLNFANPVIPGGGYLKGREGQEGSICRQTLLFPTLQKSYMYFENKQMGNKPEASDVMIYSPNVMVIRNDKYEMIHNFQVDVISASAVDNRKYHISNSEKIMMNRIRRIILTAISEKAEILILGAFGCGIFKNNPTTTAQIFHQVLVKENYQKYFYLIIFPIYNDPSLYHIFNSILSNQ